MGTISALLVDTDKLSLPLRDALDTQSDYSLFMNAFNSNGEFIWKEQIGTSSDEKSTQLSIDNLGNLYILFSL